MEVPLTAEDRAILALEGPGLVGHICKLIRLGAGAPGPDALREALTRRLPAAPQLAWRLAGPADAPVWRPDEAFDVGRHVGAVTAAEPLDAAALRAAVTRLFVQPLDRGRPLWRMDLVGPLVGGGAALVWRVHHALADGTTAMRLARDVLWAPPPASADGVHADVGGHAGPPMDDPQRPHLGGLLAREFLPSPHRSPFDARVGREREVALAVVSLPALHDAARALAGATVNDAVLGLVAGALRRWLEHRHGPIRPLRVKVPVSLHHGGDAAGNRDSWFRVDLPVDEPDPVARLTAIRAETALRKARHDAQDLDEVLDRLARVSPRLASWSGRVQRSGRTFAVKVSNIRGPDREVTVLGAPVETIHPLVEVAPHHALRVAAVSVADRLCVGFVADPAVVDDLELLASSVEREAADLAVAADRGPRP